MTERARPKAPSWAVLILIACLLVLYFPVFLMIENSFSDGLHWYREVLADTKTLEALWRSVVVAITSSAIATVLGTFAAVSLSRTKFKWSKGLSGLSFTALVVPELVFALALLSWFFVLKVPLSLLTVIAAHVTFSLSFVLMTVNGRASGLDGSLEDAARDMGASEWLVFKKVLFPLLSTSIVSGFLLAFLLSFDDFLITFYTNGVGTDTLPIRLYTAMKSGLSPKLSALSTLMLGFSALLIGLMMKLNYSKR